MEDETIGTDRWCLSHADPLQELKIASQDGQSGQKPAVRIDTLDHIVTGILVLEEARISKNFLMTCLSANMEFCCTSRWAHVNSLHVAGFCKGVAVGHKAA